MVKNKPDILSTRPLDTQLLNEAAAQGVTIDCLSFIETQPMVSEELQLLIGGLARQHMTAVFTSMNAVEAVKEFSGNKINWKIYCIGNATRKLAEESWGAGKIAGTAENAKALADVIINNKERSVVFFCGEQRLEALPLKLKSHGINVKEMVVYRTLYFSHAVKKHYDGILFFSPSAVNSFLLSNSPEAGSVAFAIGRTTASALLEKGWSNIFTADSPGKEELVKKMLSYFQMSGRI